MDVATMARDRHRILTNAVVFFALIDVSLGNAEHPLYYFIMHIAKIPPSARKRPGLIITIATVIYHNDVIFIQKTRSLYRDSFEL